MSSFTHLRAASGFSARYGASHPRQLVERAAERGMAALALTDRDGVSGAVRFALACAEADVRPVFGVDLAVPGEPDQAVPGEPRRPGAPRVRQPARGGAYVDESAPRAVFLAREGAAGWAGLCRLVTAAHAERPERPRLEWAGLDTSADSGLTVLLGADSEVGRALSAGRTDHAARLLAPWRERFGDGLRLEVVCHGRAGTGAGSVRLAARMFGFASEQGVRAVLSNAVRYADPGQHRLADVLDAARLLRPVPVRRPELLDGGERWLKDPAAMARIAEQVVEAAGERRGAASALLAETERTAAECRGDPARDLGIGSVHFPETELVTTAGRSAERTLRTYCAAGMIQRRYDHKEEYWTRLTEELDTIERLGFASYFLTVAQVVEDVRARGIRVAARGSGAGSLVNHLLGIAHADPVEHGLLMERFLSVRRHVLPDIDIDVESARRIEVYRAIIDRFGTERVATVAMPETYRVRHAIRDTGLALGLAPAEVDRLAKSFPHIRARDARAAMAELPELREVAAEARAGRHGVLWELVEGLDGLVRGMAMHPCGVLLSDSSLLSRTPVLPTSGEQLPMSQFDKDDVEHLGLLKLDVLGVRMQSVLAHAAGEVERVTGRELDLDDPEQVPPGDPETYELIRSSRTLGAFQIESPGQRDLIGRLQPASFHDLVVDISLFRPGPVAADMVRPFIEARHGRRAVRCPHPDLEPVLADTYGVVVFHEQIIEILSIMTGCDRARADEARRALGDAGRQPRVRAWFFERAAARGYRPGVLERTWEIVEAFGAYGFCKAHAVAFAVPTYQSSWLKAHHPAAFFAGILNHDPGMYPKRALLADARRCGVAILPLDINRSAAAYRIELVSESGESSEESEPVFGVRLALSEVRGISEAETARTVAGQPYASLGDWWQRARPSLPVAEHLARTGALDAFGGNRRDLLLHLTELHRGQRARGARGGQLPLAEHTHPPDPAGLPDLDPGERLGAELEALGMDASRHLMDDHRALLRELGALSAERLRGAEQGATVLVAGAKTATQTPPVRSGRRIIFVTLDDGSGLADLAFFEDSHAACAHTVFHSFLLLVRGTVQRRGPRSLTVTGEMVWDLAELAALYREGGMAAVADRLARSPDDAEYTTDGHAGDGHPTDGHTTEGHAADGHPADGRPADGRRIRMSTGYQMHPWADLRPAGDPSPSGRKLWHSSPGSAG
ncbi:DNA polymerase III subunit alpha [Streptomyces apocyni]|uniref:DNA polymerase III subunit alpha n=1 Tax=Streptomyces apocyni TaxID=2654677 RepID=UPI0012EA1577|nr:DNA polymerase III subunit alpha [Streptomyces apocyni]